MPRPAKLRRKAMAAIEKEATDKNGLRNDVVTLYQGGQYHLYTYKKYTDVRLVFAPEFDIAFFGGDPDNFEYPRYDLDICFFRAYENGKPAKIEHYLKWSADGSKEGDLVFVAGHPGRTDRLNTVASLEYLRDRRAALAAGLLEAARSFPARIRPPQPRGSSSVQGRALHRPEQPQGAGRRACRAARPGVHEAESPGRGRAAGRSFKPAAAESRTTAPRLGQDRRRPRRSPAGSSSLTSTTSGGTPLIPSSSTIARHLVRLAEEKTKPNSDRLKEYRESALKSLELKLFSEAPIYPEFEEAKLAHSLAHWKKLMPDDPLVERVLHGRSPAEAAKADRRADRSSPT